MASLSYVALSIFAIYLYSRVENGFNEPWIKGRLAVFMWGLSALSVFGLLVAAAVTWRRVPAGAKNGALILGREGLEYREGCFVRVLPWSEIAAVHPIAVPFSGGQRMTWQPKGKAPTVIWLPNTDASPISSTRHDNPSRAIAHRFAEPFERSDGTVLPIGLFGSKNAKSIIQATETRLAHLRADPDGLPASNNRFLAPTQEDEWIPRFKAAGRILEACQSKRLFALRRRDRMAHEVAFTAVPR